MTSKNSKKKLLGSAVHTDRGDGEIIKATAKEFKVKLDNGQEYVVRKTCTYLMTKKAKRLRKPIADVIASKVGLPIQEAYDEAGEPVDTTMDDLDTTDIETLKELDDEPEDQEIKTEKDLKAPSRRRTVRRTKDDGGGTTRQSERRRRTREADDEAPNDNPGLSARERTLLLNQDNQVEDIADKRLHIELLVINNLPAVVFSYDGAEPLELDAAATYGMRDSGPLWVRQV